MIATDNTTFVTYINKQSGTHSHTLLCLVVDLFPRLQTQDIAIWTRSHSGLSKHDRSSGPPISAKPAHNNRVKASVQPGPTVTTGICLGWQVVLSASLEALMQHYKSRIFEEVSRLVGSLRRPSTYRVYNDRWLCSAHFAAVQGIDPLGPTAAQIATFLYYLF